MRSAVTLVACGLLMASHASWADWSIQPKISNFSRVNDNRILEKRPETRFANITDIGAPIEFDNSDYSLVARPNVRVSRYTGSRMLDSDDVFFNLDAQRKLAAGMYGIQFGYERATTLTTELQDSGIVDTNIFRTSFNVSPYWSRQITERSLLRLTAGFSDVSFDKQGNNNNFSAFRQFSAGPELTYDFTDQLQLFSSANLSRFELPGSGDTTDSLAVQGGVIYSYSETLKGRAIFGWNFSTINFSTPVFTIVNGQLVVTQVPQEATSDGDLVTFELEKIWSRGFTSRVSWNRRFSPSSQGSRQFREEVQGGGQYQLSERTTLNLAVNYSSQTQESELITGGVFGIEQVAIEGIARYTLTQDFSIQMGVRRLMQTIASTGNSASSNEIFVGLNYNGNSLRYP